jgi:hypothetical protein
MSVDYILAQPLLATQFSKTTNHALQLLSLSRLGSSNYAKLLQPPNSIRTFRWPVPPGDDVGGVGRVRRLVAARPRKPKIADFDDPAIREEDVGGLDIPVDDLLAVQVAQRLEQLPGY